jgi:hypothetical protein
MIVPSSESRRLNHAPGPQRAKKILGVGAAGCVVAVLAACGSSSPASPTTSSGNSVSASSRATPTTTATPASLSQLNTIVLRSSDLPSGWKGAPYQPDSSDSTDNAEITECVGTRDTDSDMVADAHSDDFSLGNATISSDASSYRSQSDLDSDVAALHSPKLSSCFTQVMNKELTSSLPAGSTIESSSIKVTPGSAGGPANVIATGSGVIKVEANGQEVSVYLTVAFITGPLIEAEIDTENLGAPVPASVVNPLVATVANRAAKG